MRAAVIAAVFLAAVSLGGCEERTPMSVATTDNKDYQVALLFTHDGCNVYRFVDSYRERYFVTCRDARYSATVFDHRESCGKNCSRTVDENVETIEGVQP